MPTSEYLNWIRYFEEKADDRERTKQAKDGNLLAMSEEQIIGALT